MFNLSQEGESSAFVAPMHMWQRTPNGTWSAWVAVTSSSPAKLASTSVGRNADGRLEVFATPAFYNGGERNLWHAWQRAPNSAWSGWATIH